jgi:hypothetical protein
MAAKELSVIVRAVDQLSSPMNASAAAVARFAVTVSQSSKKAQGDVVGINSAIARSLEPIIGGLGRVKDALLSIQGAFVAVGGAILAGVAAHEFNQAAYTLDEIGKAARRLGLSVQDLSSLKYQAELANVPFASLADQISTAQKNLGQFAVTGGGKAADAFRLLNVPVRDSLGNIRSINDLLPEMADRIGHLSDAERVFSATRIFGDSSILQLLELGGSALRKRAGEAGALGVLFTPEMTRAAEEYKDSITRVSAAWLGLRAVVVQQVAPIITDVLNRFAFALARVPDILRGVGAQISGLVSGDAGRYEEAKGTLKDLALGTLDLAWVAIKEYVKTTVTLFVETLVFVLRAAAPTLSDIFKDILGPLLSQIPSVKIESSMGSQVARLDADRAALAVRIAKYKNAEDLAANSTSPGDPREYLSGLGPPPESLESFDKRSADIRARFAAQETERAKSLQEAYSKAAAEIGGSYANAFDAVREKADKVWQLANAIAKPAAGSSYGNPGSGDSVFDQMVNNAQWLAARIPAVAEAVGSAWDVVRQRIGGAVEAAKAFFAEGERIAGLRVQILRLSGNENAAQLLEAGTQGRKDLREAILRGAPEGELELIRRRNALQLESLGVSQRAKGIEAELADATDRYNQTLERNAQLVQAGAIRPFQATRQDQQAKQALADALAAAEQEIRSGPDAEKVMAALRAKLQEVRRLVGQGGRVAGQTFAEGLSDGFQQFLDRAEDVYNQAKDGALQLADSFSTGLSAAIVDTISGVKSLKDAFRDFAATTLRNVAQLITQILVLRAIAGIAGAFAAGGETAGTAYAGSAADVGSGGLQGIGGVPTAFANSGGLVVPGGIRRFAGGGYVPGPNINRDIVPALLTPGEYVMSRREVAAAGRSTGGAGPGGTAIVINQTNNFNGGGGDLTPSQIKKLTRDAVAEGLQRYPTFRGIVREAVK